MSVRIYLVAAIFLMLMALLIMSWSLVEVVDHVLTAKGLEQKFIAKMLSAVGAIIIAIAVLDVAKSMVEEEVLRSKKLQSVKDAREALTKIMVIVSIAASIEGLIYILKAGAIDMQLLVYPAILLFTAVFIMVGLGLYQQISLQAELIEQQLKIGATDG